MESIRIKNDNLKIEVNDEGEYIILPFSDVSFPSRFFGAIDRIDALKVKAENKTEEFRKEESDITDIEIFSFVEELCKEAMQVIDDTFGKDTCRKVFGDMTTDMESIAEFLRLITPFFEKYSEKKKKELSSKYNFSGKAKL